MGELGIKSLQKNGMVGIFPRQGGEAHYPVLFSSDRSSYSVGVLPRAGHAVAPNCANTIWAKFTIGNAPPPLKAYFCPEIDDDCDHGAGKIKKPLSQSSCTIMCIEKGLKDDWNLFP